MLEKIPLRDVMTDFIDDEALSNSSQDEDDYVNVTSHKSRKYRSHEPSVHLLTTPSSKRTVTSSLSRSNSARASKHVTSPPITSSPALVDVMTSSASPATHFANLGFNDFDSSDGNIDHNRFDPDRNDLEPSSCLNTSIEGALGGRAAFLMSSTVKENNGSPAVASTSRGGYNTLPRMGGSRKNKRYAKIKDEKVKKLI